ncbi:MAG: hypothetical protein JWM80_4529 [Cyanobacteria bacterium RYN_339]|nr:hypothetical protein [Cyanobacteria bacterium RYN_339]
MAGVDFMRKLLDASFPAPPIVETTDIWLTEVDVGRVVFEGRPSARFANPMGAIHGGWIATLLDSAMGCAVHAALDAGQAYTTVEMKTVFLRPVSEAGGILRCEAQVLHKGSRIASAEGKVFDVNGKLVAHGSETCLIMDVAGQAPR